MTSTRPKRPRLRHGNTRTEPFRILVGSSGDTASLGAIRMALAVAKRKSATVHALAVATPFPHTFPSVYNIGPPALIDEQDQQAALEKLRHQLTGVRGAGGWTMRATVGFPAESIVDAARRWPASLVIVGLGHHGFLDRLIGSETAVAIVRRASSPVLAVAPDAEKLPVQAVVAMDFTESSIEAATLAATLLGPNGRLTLLHSVPLWEDSSEPPPAWNVYTVGAREQLDRISDRIRRRTKRDVQGVVAPGPIAEQLVSFAEQHHCDLIALGGHEMSLLERLLGGSVRARVLRSAGCSVLVCPPVHPDE